MDVFCSFIISCNKRTLFIAITTAFHKTKNILVREFFFFFEHNNICIDHKQAIQDILKNPHTIIHKEENSPKGTPTICEMFMLKHKQNDGDLFL